MKKELLHTFYKEMLRIRLAEEKVAELYPSQQMRCPTHLCIGQEATPVGICQALDKQDYAFGNHRSHGHYLAKGGSLPKMIAEFYGKDDGCARGKGGSMHLIDMSSGFLGAVPILAATIPMAVGAALGSRMQGENRVAVAFFGDAATEEGAFYEAVNYAALKKLPVLFVCENNLYSTHTPLSERRPANREIFEIASGFGIFSAKGDGNNVEEVYAMATEAVKRARAGEGPSFLEFTTYRWLEHCGPNEDSKLGYRTAQEVQEWREKCPIVQFEKRHEATGDLTAQDIKTMREEVRDEVEAAFVYAMKSKFPDEKDAFEGVYA